MDRVVFLGTSRCLPTAHRDNTSILFESDDDAILVDCSGKPYQGLLKCGAKLENVNTILISHYHVDHCYGLPSLLSSFHLACRKASMTVLALPEVMEKIRDLLEIFGYPESWAKVQALYPIEFTVLSRDANNRIYDGPGLTVYSSVNGHVVPNLALKVVYKRINKTVVYTSDTSAPNAAVVDLAMDSDYLIHETNFLSAERNNAIRDGHSTAGQVGEVARTTRTKKLYLVHHGIDDPEQMEKMMAEVGPGEFSVSVPDDMQSVLIE